MAPVSADDYFAVADEETIGEKLVEKLKASGPELLTQLQAMQEKAWRVYYGFNPSGQHATSAITRGGKQGELALARINHLRSLTNTLTNIITSQQVTWEPKAVNYDYQAIIETDIARAVLEYYWTDAGLQNLFNRAVEESLAFSEGFIHLRWDKHAGEVVGVDPNTIDDPAPLPLDGEEPGPPEPEQTPRILKSGDLRYTNVSSWDVIRDPHKPSWKNLDWVIVREYENRFEVAEWVDDLDKREKVLSLRSELKTESGLAAMSASKTDDIPVYYFYHRPTALLPFGKSVVFLSDGTVIESDVLGWEKWPLYRIAPAEMTGTPFGYTPFFEAMGVQELIDSLASSAATNLTTFGTQNIIFPYGNEWDPDNVFGGMRALKMGPNGEKPEALQLCKTPAELYAFMDTLKKDEELIFGLNAVVRGQAQSDKLSGSALALLQSQVQQQASTLTSTFLTAVKDSGSGTMDGIRRNVTAPRMIEYTGQAMGALVREVEYTGASFGRVKKVTIEIGNPLAQTATGRLEMAKELLQFNLITTPEQYTEIIQTGRIEPLTRGLHFELTNIVSENQDISDGTTPQAMLHDNHKLHAREHRTTVANAQARKDPKILKAFMDHMNQHFVLEYNIPVFDPMTGGPAMIDAPNYQDLLNQAVLQDPQYHFRMKTMMGDTPPPNPLTGMPADIPLGPPPGPPGMGGPPPPGVPPGPPPPGGSPNGAPPPKPPGLPPMPGKDAKQPRLPTQPLTGKQWNPADAGGAVPPPQ